MYICIYYILYYILYIHIYYILLLLYYIIQYILYYTLLFYSSFSYLPSSILFHLPFLSFSSSLLFLFLSFLLSYSLLFLSSPLIYSSSQSFTILFWSISHSSLITLFQSSHPINTCRYLDTLIYIQQSFPSLLPLFYSSTILTPHVLSEWMVEVWCVYKYVGSGLCFVLVFVIYYIILYSPLLFYSPLPFSPPLPSSLLSSPIWSPLPILYNPLLFLSFPILFSSSVPIISFIVYVSGLPYTYLYSISIQQFHPACFIGVDGWGVWLVFVCV